jgi:sphinganine-1-phosphate aldolase
MDKFLNSFNKVLPKVEKHLLICSVLIVLNITVTEGVTSLTRDLVKVVRKFPFVNSIIKLILDHEVTGAVKLLSGPGGNKEGDEENKKSVVLPIPEVGVSPNEVLDIVKHIHDTESAAEDGKAFAYTYTTTTDMKEFSRALSESYSSFSETSGLDSKEHDEMLGQVWSNFMHTNALNPMMYPSLRKFETEIVSMATWMCHGDTTTAGSLTSGGTESILMAIKCYRDRARKLNPKITRPNMIAPQTIHPAFEKAAHYFDIEIIHVKVNTEYRVDLAEVEKACNRNTILIVGSAPQYCHAVVDPIEELAKIALRKGLPLHVDACFGGFMLPWLEKLGKKVPLWDFRVNGVTSISADVHKYGYSSKGASVILYKNDDIRSYQYFAYSEWPGGLFGSPSMSGSRPGGMIAAGK